MHNLGEKRGGMGGVQEILKEKGRQKTSLGVSLFLGLQVRGASAVEV